MYVVTVGKAHEATGTADVAIFEYGSLDLVEATQGLYVVRRSEEHTSELQSLMRISYAVFCLKKQNDHSNNTNTPTASLCQTTHVVHPSEPRYILTPPDTYIR